MTNEWRALDQIEWATQQQPHCSCGRPTTPVVRADGLWLECTSLQEPMRGWRQAIARIVSGPHAQRHISDWVLQTA